MISVIVPVYNTEKYLNRCIQSILTQTYKEFELLLIDDGSTDSSRAICDKFAAQDARVRVFYKENGGVSSARNLGLDNARGEWVTFVDSDDCVYPSWLENFIKNCENVDLICQGLESTRPIKGEQCGCNTYTYGVNFLGSVDDGLCKLIDLGIVGYVFIKCFKKHIIDENLLRFNTYLTIQEDEEFVLRYMEFCDNIRFTDLIGYHYEYPDYATKYTNLAKYYEVTKLLYNIVKNRDYGVWREITRYYCWFYVCGFVSLFEKEYDKRKLLLEFRKNLGNYVLNTNMFFITKWLIFVDFSGYISTMVLRLHLKVKSMLCSYRTNSN